MKQNSPEFEQTEVGNVREGVLHTRHKIYASALLYIPFTNICVASGSLSFPLSHTCLMLVKSWDLG